MTSARATCVGVPPPFVKCLRISIRLQTHLLVVYLVWEHLQEKLVIVALCRGISLVTWRQHPGSQGLSDGPIIVMDGIYVSLQHPFVRCCPTQARFVDEHVRAMPIVGAPKRWCALVGLSACYEGFSHLYKYVARCA